MKSYTDTINQQLQTYNWRGIFKYYQADANETKLPPGFSTIGPFGESFQELVSAVALKGKPLAEFNYEIYDEEKSICDQIIKIYGVEKLEDSASRCVWLFKYENKANAIKGINELKSIFNHISCRGYITFDDHKKMGELYGYSKRDINTFLASRVYKAEMKEGQEKYDRAISYGNAQEQRTGDCDEL